ERGAACVLRGLSQGAPTVANCIFSRPKPRGKLAEAVRFRLDPETPPNMPDLHVPESRQPWLLCHIGQSSGPLRLRTLASRQPGPFLLITRKCRFDVASHDYRLESRPHWSFDIWAGRVREETMGTLIVVCPATGEEVSTGLEMDLPTLQRLELGRVYCTHFRNQHTTG